VTLVAYSAQDQTSAVPQWVYDSQSRAVSSGTSSLNFHIVVPSCYAQVDFVFRNKPIDPLDGSEYYSSDKVGDSNLPGSSSVGPRGWWHGGSTDCDPQPTESFVPVCSGMQVNITNGPTANIDAVVTVTDAAGNSQRKHVAPGSSGSVTVPAATAGTVTVRDNSSLSSTTGHWNQPSNC
jgi:hypothetical protein